MEREADLYRRSRDVVSFAFNGWPIAKHNPLAEKMARILLRITEGDLDYFPTEKHDGWPRVRIHEMVKPIF